MRAEGYNPVSQVPSELTAIGASTRALMFLAIGCGAAAFGKRFRLYSIASIVVLLAFGGLTFLEAPRLQANLPTPWIGLWERINISVFLLWDRGAGDGAVAERSVAVTTARRDAMDDVKFARINKVCAASPALR